MCAGNDRRNCSNERYNISSAASTALPIVRRGRRRPPVFMRRAQGAYFWDVDGNRYIDYLGAYGALILGHAHPAVTEAVAESRGRGTVFGTPHELEITFVEHLKSAIPSLRKSGWSTRAPKR